MTLQKRRERYRSELRAETLSAARKLIQEEGYQGLTIRKLAQRMECSPMALYSYFADKQALLTALALEGFEKVAKRFDSTVHRDPLTAVRKILLDYIAYAEENPNEYRILFLSVETLGELKLSREDLQERNPAFGALIQARGNVHQGRCASRRRVRCEYSIVDSRSWGGVPADHGAEVSVWQPSTIR